MSLSVFQVKRTTTFVKHLVSSKTVLFDGLYIFKYSRRRGTPAADFEDTVSESEKTARFLELENVHRRCQAEGVQFICWSDD